MTIVVKTLRVESQLFGEKYLNWQKTKILFINSNNLKKTTLFAMFAVCFPREVILCPELCGDLSALRWRRQMMMSVCSIPRFVEARAPNTHCVSILYYIILSPCPWLIIYTITPKNALWTHAVISDTSPQTFNGRTSHTYRQSWV